MSVTATIQLIGLMLLAPQTETKDGKALVEQMMKAIGGKSALHARKGVSYRYHYIDPKGDADISLERYVFDGEHSWAEYEKRSRVMAGADGTVIQGYNGQEAWTTLDGTLVEDENQLKMASFLRKTNYYWFAMMFKLLDPGLTYQYKGTQTVDGIHYDLVEVGFEKGVGDVQDTYLLYINPFTHLVDQFLFTVMDFGLKDPLLMRVQHHAVDGVLLPTVRRYVAADWKGKPKSDDWTLEIMTDLRFEANLKPDLFQKP